MNLPSRAQMVGMAERLQSIEGQLNEIKAMLHQMQGNAADASGGYSQTPTAAAHQAPAVCGRRAKMNAAAGSGSGRSRSCFDPGADSVRG